MLKNAMHRFVCAAAFALAATGASASTFHVEQYDVYLGTSLSAYQNYAANNEADYTADVDVIDFTDDPRGFNGDFDGSSPWPASEQTGITGRHRGINNTFFARITASFSTLIADTFNFQTINDDGVFVFVDGNLVINDPSLHPERTFSGTAYLEKGQHELEIFFFERRGEASLEFAFADSNSPLSLRGGDYVIIGEVPVLPAGALMLTGIGALWSTRRRKG